MKVKKILSILLYLLPAVFFIICYFLIITSGEDIFQGANTSPNIINDGLAAFHHSSRLADMYTWSVINFFDYSFSFGPDTIFRLLDVFAALSIFYMVTYLVLKRRPRLTLKDAAIFNLSFLFVFLTQHGYTLYAGFSAIHNYLFIAFFSLLFLIFYAREIWGKSACPFKSKSLKTLFPFLMFVLGFIFGFSSNVTSIVFLLALIAYCIYLKLTKQKLQIKRFILSWHGASVLGVIIAIILIYLVGNGLSDYESTSEYITSYDYLPLKEIFTNIPSAIVRIATHNVKNFGRFLVPFILASIPIVTVFIISKNRQHFKLDKFTVKDKNYIAAILMFIILHILVFSQLVYPTRLILPAYLLAIVLFLYVSLHYTKNVNSEALPYILACILVLSNLGLVSVRTFFAIEYRSRIIPILNEIKTSEQKSICLDNSTIGSKSIPILHLGQDALLAEWALPQTIYDKSVTICEASK